MYTMCKTYGIHTIRGVAWVTTDEGGLTKATDLTFLQILNRCVTAAPDGINAPPLTD